MGSPRYDEERIVPIVEADRASCDPFPFAFLGDGAEAAVFHREVFGVLAVLEVLAVPAVPAVLAVLELLVVLGSVRGKRTAGQGKITALTGLSESEGESDAGACSRVARAAAPVSPLRSSPTALDARRWR